MAEKPTTFVMGVSPDGKVVIQLEAPAQDIRLTPEQALDMAEGLVEAAREAAAGRAVLIVK